MNVGGPAIVMAFNQKIQKEVPQPGRRYENSVMSSFYGSPDDFIIKINEIKFLEEKDLKQQIEKINYKMQSAYVRQRGQLAGKADVAKSYVSKIDDVKMAKE